ncbi:hypothetical protein J1605_017046 [Eschrichtius robustus]|uniref:Uncharacterized protein n=1 Tax=Eschrichtius robustus TaxID=9764 RepID=A0AB34I2Y9_ESCRO|nr:hypothetical protein J1605_017046 [Eschrichtius robustus]
MAWNTNLRWRLPVICLLLQVALVVLFGVFVRYDLDADPHWIEKKMSGNVSSDLDNEFYYRYPRTSGRREPEEEMLPTAPWPAPLRLPTRGTSQCLKIKLGKWPDVHKFLSPPESSPGRAHSFQVPPETSNLPVREPFLMSSKDLSLILVTSQWVTLVPLSSCAHALHVKGVLPMSRAAGVAHWPTSPAAGRGVGDHGTYHLLAWRGRKSTPEFSGICGAVVKSMALESPDLTSIMALPLTRLSAPVWASFLPKGLVESTGHLGFQRSTAPAGSGWGPGVPEDNSPNVGPWRQAQNQLRTCPGSGLKGPAAGTGC